jgi:pyrroloquinoline quinone biosynthesis protein E
LILSVSYTQLSYKPEAARKAVVSRRMVKRVGMAVKAAEKQDGGGVRGVPLGRAAGNGGEGRLAPNSPVAIGLVAELTGRDRVDAGSRAEGGRGEELDTLAWQRVFVEAAALGVCRVRLLDAQLSGGAPRPRGDLVDLVAHAREAGLNPCLATSGVGISTRTMRNLWEAGLVDIEIAMGDADAVSADRMAGQRGVFQRRHALAVEAVRLGLPLTVSFVANHDSISRIAAMVDLAQRMKAKRVVIVDVCGGGGLAGPAVGAAPTLDQTRHAMEEVERLRRIHGSRITIAVRLPGFAVDSSAGHPQPAIHVTASGAVRLVGTGDVRSGSRSRNVRDDPLAVIVASSSFCSPACQRTEASDVV